MHKHNVHDFTKWCQDHLLPFSGEKTMHMHRRAMLPHLCTPQHPYQMNLTVPIATHELTHQFCTPNFEPMSLWLLKSAIFFSSCSHFLNMVTFSSPNSVLIDACMFLILLITLCMTQRSNFLSNRINFIHRHKLSPCLQQRLLQVYGKMFIHTTDGIVVENFILYNIMCMI